MSPKLYKLYIIITRIKRHLHRKVSQAGRMMIAFAGLSVLFGINTRQTMIYQLAALAVILLLIAFPLSFLFRNVFRVRRILPETCTAGEKLTYFLHLENSSDKRTSGLFYTEISGSRFPAFEEFDSIQEDGESDRNLFDRKFGYYRWLWLLKRSSGAHFETFPLPALEAGEKRQVEVFFTPTRRGYISLSGYSIYRLEPLGLFKKELFFPDAEKILVLPKMFPVVQAEMDGSRKYHQGGVSGATSCGDSGEFVSLREYRPGDPVKHIDWKATAKSGETIVRQYQDEYFSRYGILLDTFNTSAINEVFEDAVSIAASIIVQQDRANNLIELLFAGDSCISTLSTGRGQSTEHQMLEVLACIGSCNKRVFSELSETVMAHTSVLSGLILIYIDLDDQRKKLIEYLKSIRIPHKVILVVADIEEGERLITEMQLPEVRIFNVRDTFKTVELK